MALTQQFVFGAPCGGGGHFTVTSTLTPGGSRVFEFTRGELLAPVTAEEAEATVRVILRMYAKQLEGQTPLQMKTKIEVKTLNLTVGP